MDVSRIIILHIRGAAAARYGRKNQCASNYLYIYELGMAVRSNLARSKNINSKNTRITQSFN